MKIILIIILIIIPIAIALFRSWKVQNSLNQKFFLTGHTPDRALDGFYKGSVNFETTWQGKKFNASSSSGINIIGNIEKYPFKTYAGKGLTDKDLEVLKIDYNISENPFWLRFILDELVETEKGKFLGKVNLNIIPGMPFSLGFFKLEK